MKKYQDPFEKLFNPFKDRWFNIFSQHFKQIVITTILIFLSIIIFLGWLSAKKVKEVVVDDFNKQQLVLAEYAASMIENNLSHIKRELILLSLSPTIQYSEKTFLFTRLNIAFSSIKDVGGNEIRYIQSERLRTHIINGDRYNISDASEKDIKLLKWAEDKGNKDIILVNNVARSESNHQDGLLISFALPVWQVSVDDIHPISTNKFSGILIITVDAAALIERVTKGIKSVKESYVWVIDKKGTFLYHPASEFIGKNAFSVREEKTKNISFVRINEIQKEKMLKGETGTSWYISGWHKDMEGEMKKLIAFAPIKLHEKQMDMIWSVAVVAPINAVQGAIDSIQIRQFILEGFIILIILICGMFLVALMLRWSQSLKYEVEKKTRELKQSEYQYKSLIENANDIIFTVDKHGTILSINKAGASFFNADTDCMVGQNIAEFCFSEESGHLQLTTIEKVFNTGINKKITYSVNISNREFWLNTSFTLLNDEDGKPMMILGISRDITAEKKKEREEQMYHAEKLASMGTLAAGVAHEINNPLAIILGFVDLLIEKYPKDSQEYDILKTVEKQATNAKRVVENLLSFSRYTEYHEEEVDIKENIESVLAIIKNTMKIKNIYLESRLSEGLPKVKADAGELQQVFLNILNNAIHAMPEGGTLTITTLLCNGKDIQIRFSDTGHGIKREHRTKIFDPLFTTKKVGEGTGLGLSVSYGIITKYGGNITFETTTREESEKTGTTFIISLPSIADNKTP